MKYNDYLKVFVHLMKHIDPKDSLWQHFAQTLTREFEPFTEQEFKQGGKVLRNNIREYQDIFYEDL